MCGRKKVAGLLSGTRLMVRACAPHPWTPAGATALAPVTESITVLHDSDRIAPGMTPALPMIQPHQPAEGKSGFCQSLAVLLLACQTLANAGCTSYRAAMADLGAASRAAIAATPGYDTLPEVWP